MSRLGYVLEGGALSLYVDGELLIGPIPPATTSALADALRGCVPVAPGQQPCPCTRGWTFSSRDNAWLHPDHKRV